MGYDWEIIDTYTGKWVDIIHRCNDPLVFLDKKGIRILKDSYSFFQSITLYVYRESNRIIGFNIGVSCPDCKVIMPEAIWFQVELLLE